LITSFPKGSHLEILSKRIKNDGSQMDGWTCGIMEPDPGTGSFEGTVRDTFLEGLAVVGGKRLAARAGVSPLINVSARDVDNLYVTAELPGRDGAGIWKFRSRGTT
jgi:hypothetical protein